MKQHNGSPGATSATDARAASTRALREMWWQRHGHPFGQEAFCPKCKNPAHWDGEDPHCVGGCTPDEFVVALIDEIAGATTDPGAPDSSLGEIPEYPADVLPVEAKKLVAAGGAAGLPPALVGGAAVAALAAAIGPKVALEVRAGPPWVERAILWVPLLGPAGSGKSPSQSLAFGPLRERDIDAEHPLLLGDLTFEALVRELAALDGAVTIDADELSQRLRGLDEYKRGGGDRSRFLSLWDGAPWTYTRVGGSKSSNQTRIRIARPTVVVCGGLQPHLHELLGPPEDGLRARWLPHLASMPNDVELGAPVSYEWSSALSHLLDKRDVERVWRFSGDGSRAFDAHRQRWHHQARNGERAGVATALWKADRQLARLALVLVEADLKHPGRAALVSGEVVERAAQYVDFTLDCWRALPDHETLALTPRDRNLYKGVDALEAWTDQHGATSRRDLQRAHVGGLRSGPDLDRVIEQYSHVHPGCVTTTKPAGGGRAVVLVHPPKRSPSTSKRAVSPNGDTDVYSGQNPYEHWGLGDVATGDTEAGDTGSGDIAQLLLETGEGDHE